MKSIEIKKKTVLLLEGHQNPELADLYFNLGKIYRIQIKLELAEKNILESLEIKKKAFSNEDYPEQADQLYELGIVYFEQGKLEMAEKYFLKSLELKRKNYGEDHKELAEIYNNLGNVYCN